MDSLTIAAAARLCHCDRRTLQRAIHTGRLHLDAQHGLSREELISTGYLLEDTPLAAPLETPLLAALERLTCAVEGVLEELRHWREHAAQTPLITPQATPQGPPLAAPLEAPQAVPQRTPTHYGRPGIAPGTLQAIAEARARHPDLTMKAFAQLLFDQGIYRGRARDGRDVPADHSRLRRWLAQARRAGLMAEP